MESVTQSGCCSLEQQLTVAPVVVPPQPPPCSLIERSESVLASSFSPSELSVARERPSDALLTPVLAALSPRTPLDDAWLTAEGDMLQDLFRAWDAEGVDEAQSSNGGSDSNRTEPAPCESLTVEASTKLPRTKTRPPKTFLAKRSPRKSASNRDKSKPTTISSSTRQKLEMQVLRSKEHDLSEMLRRLKKAVRTARTKNAASTATGCPESVSLCEAVANTQRVLLEQAQRENQQLKLTMLDCKETVKSLRRAILKRVDRHAVRHTQRLLLAKTLQLPPQRSAFNFDLTSEDRKLFQSMVAGTNTMRGNMDIALELLRTKTPREHSGSFRSWDVRRDAAMTLFAEVVDCEEVPFRRVQVENATRVLRDQKKAGSQQYDAQVFGGSPEVVLTKSHFRYSNALESGMCRGREASRDFKDDDDHRSYSVNIAYIEPIDASGNAAPGFLFKSQAWTILTEQVYSVEGKQHRTTLIQSYSTLTPVLIREPSSVRWEKELIEKFVIPVWDRGISAGHRTLENALLDLQ